jgi:uncharacterized protein (TIGR04255 family)
MTIATAETSDFSARRMTRQRYPHPPIVEALVDIQVAFSDLPSLEEIAKLGVLEEPLYPRREMVHSFSMVVDPRAGTATNATQQLVGYRYWSARGDAVIQLRNNGLMFSKVKPYDDWEWQQSLNQIQRLWHSYAAQLHPQRVTRIAVRYINLIEFQSGEWDLREYFHTRPELADPRRATKGTFLMRVESPLEGIDGGMLMLTQGSAESSTPGRGGVLLDLDLFRTVDIPASTAEPMWGMLGELHDRENDAFESMITDKTRSLFK